MDAKMREEARKIKDATANGHNGEPSSRKSNAKLSTLSNVNFNGSTEVVSLNTFNIKEPTMNCAPKKNRIHYSGPLFPPRGNLDEMLKEHEKQIQHVVRKARLDKAKTKKDFG